MEELRTLSHDLNSSWGIINWIAHESSENLSSLEESSYKAILERAKEKIGNVLTQLPVYLTQATFLEDITKLVYQLTIQNSSQVVLQLAPLIKDLQILLRDLQ